MMHDGGIGVQLRAGYESDLCVRPRPENARFRGGVGHEIRHGANREASIRGFRSARCNRDHVRGNETSRHRHRRTKEASGCHCVREAGCRGVSIPVRRISTSCLDVIIFSRANPSDWSIARSMTLGNRSSGVSTCRPRQVDRACRPLPARRAAPHPPPLLSRVCAFLRLSKFVDLCFNRRFGDGEIFIAQILDRSARQLKLRVYARMCVCARAALSKMRQH